MFGLEPVDVESTLGPLTVAQLTKTIARVGRSFWSLACNVSVSTGVSILGDWYGEKEAMAHYHWPGGHARHHRDSGDRHRGRVGGSSSIRRSSSPPRDHGRLISLERRAALVADLLTDRWPAEAYRHIDGGAGNQFG